MPAVFVHGNPETRAIWEPLLGELHRDDVVCLSPPGFGAPIPAAWGATRLEYRDWLIAELETIDGPIDLVGHDWGGGHAVAAVMERPELVRTWCSDVIGVFDPEYVWHDIAQVWQTPDAGEEMLAGWAMTSPQQRAERTATLGMPPEIGQRVAAAFDDTMARCILALYRSAAQPAVAEVGAQLVSAAARPGLAIRATDDHFVGTEAMQRRAAERAGARVVVLEGVGHWWMLQNPKQGADVLRQFWQSL